MNTQLLASFFALSFFAVVSCNRSDPEKAGSGASPAAANTASKVVKVAVGEDGFQPSSITVSRGENVMLEFTRTAEKTCADKVVFPDLGVSKDLPLNKAVAINVPTDQARKLTFQCGMAMYKSSVVVQ